MTKDMDVSDWTIDDVSVWMHNNGFKQYADIFKKQHNIDGAALLTLTEDDLRTPPLEIKVLGDIKRLSLSIHKLQLQYEPSFMLNRSPPKYRHSLDSHFSNGHVTDIPVKDSDKKLPPEYIKLMLSYIYMFSVFWLTAFVMAVVHDRVPDMKKYPPLPDIVLDNLPYIPWAFNMCEFIAVILTTLWCLILTFHKNR